MCATPVRTFELVPIVTLLYVCSKWYLLNRPAQGTWLSGQLEAPIRLTGGPASLEALSPSRVVCFSPRSLCPPRSLARRLRLSPLLLSPSLSLPARLSPLRLRSAMPREGDRAGQGGCARGAPAGVGKQCSDYWLTNKYIGLYVIPE